MSVVPSNLPIEAKFHVGVLIGLPCSGRGVPPEMIVAMAMNQAPTGVTQAHLIVKGFPVEDARNIITEKALEIDAKYLWFVDDDTIPPPNTLSRMLYVMGNNPQIGVLGGVYVTKTDPPAPVFFRGMGAGSFWRWKKNDIFEVTGMGAGCMLIDTTVFKELPKPWFKFTKVESFVPEIPSESISEDIYFCNNVRAAGRLVCVHGGILCDHHDQLTGKVYQLPPDSYPLQTDTPSLANPLPQEASLESPNKKGQNIWL